MTPGDTLTRHEPAKTNEEAGGHPLPLSLAEHQTRASGWPSRSLAHQGVCALTLGTAASLVLSEEVKII